MSPDDGNHATSLRGLRRAISSGAVLAPLPLAVLMFLGSLLSSLGQVALFADNRTFAYGILSGTIGTLLVVVPLALIGWLQRRFDRTIPVPWMLALFVAVGTSRMWTVGGLRARFDVPATFSDRQRLWVGAVQGIAWLVIASTYFAARDRFLAARVVVLEEQALLEERARRQSALSSAIARELADSIGRRVEHTVARSRQLVRDALDLEGSVEVLRRVAGSLRDAIDDEIRPMSRQLWTEAPAEQMRLTTRMGLRLGCYAMPYPVIPIGVFGMIAGIGLAIAMPDPDGTLAMLGFVMAAVVVVLRVVDRFLRTPGVAAVGRFWFGVFAASCVVLVVPGMATRLGWTPEEAQYWMLLFGVGLGVITASISIALGLTGTWSSLLERARASLSAAEVSQRIEARELAEASRVLSRHLHSSLQGRLMAIALELERAADVADRSIAEEALHRLESLLDTPLVRALDRPRIDLAPTLEALVAEWSAIADVRLHVDLRDEVADPQVVVGVVEEALSNAVRHAQATRVDIAVTQEVDDVRITVTNDGILDASRVEGLGSRWLDAVSPDSWQLREAADGAGIVLDVRLRAAIIREPAR